MKTATILLASAAAANALSLRGQDYLMKQEFKEFMVKYGKTYANKNEEEARFKVFLENVELAAQWGKEDPTAIFGVTKFSDLTQEEFQTMYTNYMVKQIENATVMPKPVTAAPENFDWVSLGATTPVKDQGQCGSCWAFSVIGTLESASYLAGHEMQELSAQALVSCDTTCYGCGGCWTDVALDYVVANGGAPSIESYPYTSGQTTVDGTCMPWTPAPNTAVASYSYATEPCTFGKCNTQDKAAVAQVLSTTQPLSICVDASKWNAYRGGVMTDKSCSTSARNQDHCVQLVGYQGLDATDGYYIVRNQWGQDWGVATDGSLASSTNSGGYILLSTSSSGGNTCGLLNTPIAINVA